MKKDYKKKLILEQAFEELEKETGLDHRKIILGDSKERKKMEWKRREDTLKEID